MIYVFAILALGLLVAAAVNYRRDKGVAIFFACCAALNMAGIVKVLATDDERAWHLEPQQESGQSATD